MRKKLYQNFIELTNFLPVSKIIMKFAKSSSSRFIVPSYAKIYQVNVKEAENPLKSYPSLHDFFVRGLKQGSRTFDDKQNTIISPVDAMIEQFGEISINQEISVKNQSYSIEEMLGDAEFAEKYLEGSFIVLYLSPSHYHRIHSPVSGIVSKQFELGSTSYPVNKLGLTYGKAPLSKNYRTITEVKEDDENHVAVVKVGAMFINTIEITHSNEKVQKGEELAYFSFGSTVVLLFEKDKIVFSDYVALKKEIKAGEIVAFKKNVLA